MLNQSLMFCHSDNDVVTHWNDRLKSWRKALTILQIPIFDPDAVANILQATASSLLPIEAARQVLKSASEHLDRGQSFAVETTLSGKNYLRMMLDAKKRGFEIVLVYIGTETVEINLARIRNRVIAGGA